MPSLVGANQVPDARLGDQSVRIRQPLDDGNRPTAVGDVKAAILPDRAGWRAGAGLLLGGVPPGRVQQHGGAPMPRPSRWGSGQRRGQLQQSRLQLLPDAEIGQRRGQTEQKKRTRLLPIARSRWCDSCRAGYSRLPAPDRRRRGCRPCPARRRCRGRWCARTPPTRGPMRAVIRLRACSSRSSDTKRSARIRVLPQVMPVSTVIDLL